MVLTKKIAILAGTLVATSAISGVAVAFTAPAKAVEKVPSKVAKNEATKSNGYDFWSSNSHPFDSF